MIWMSDNVSWMLENISMISQPLIVAGIMALAVYWRKAGRVGKDALARVEHLGESLSGLNETVDLLNKTLSEIHDKMIHTDHRLTDLETEMARQRRRSHDHANHLQTNEVRISVLEARKHD